MSGGRYSPAKCPERQCLPVTQWPDSDRLRWEMACTPVSILEEEGGELTHLSGKTCEKTAKGWGRFLTYLQYYAPEALLDQPNERLTRERIRGYIRHLESLENSTSTVLCRLQELGDAARIFTPDYDLSLIRRLSSTVRARHRPAREKHARIMADELAELGYRLMRDASRLSGKKAEVTYRDGLMLVMLVHLPVRRKNFTALTIGESLVHRQGHWFVTLTPAQTKTHAHFEAELHLSMVPWLEEYLAVHRPRLLACTGRWHGDPGERLWISSHGSAMAEIAIYDRVTKRTAHELGETISPHGFRDILASTIASHAPQHIHAAAPLLGHASLRTTEKYYRIARAQEGHKRYVQAIQHIRESARG